MPERLQPHQETMFFDPFAENGAEEFNPLLSHAAMWARYLNKEVEHDYTADRFVSDHQALMMDSIFLGRYEEAELMAASMHRGCQHDHELSKSFMESSLSATDHDHPDNKGQHEAEASELSNNNKKKDKEKKKKLRQGWLSWSYRN